MPHTLSSSRQGKVVITGSGRAGTSFLVRLLTRMGYDTGYTIGDDGWDPRIRAGCEIGGTVNGTASDVCDHYERLPRIVKSPSMAFYLKTLIRLGCKIDHVVLPLRDFDEVFQSRLALSEEHPCMTMCGWGDRDRAAVAVGKTVEACVLFGIPITPMRYPDLVLSAEYCHGALSRVFPDLENRREEFDDVFESLQLMESKSAACSQTRSGSLYAVPVP